MLRDCPVCTRRSSVQQAVQCAPGGPVCPGRSSVPQDCPVCSGMVWCAPGLSGVHQTVQCAPGRSSVHQTVQCALGLSSVFRDCPVCPGRVQRVPRLPSVFRDCPVCPGRVQCAAGCRASLWRGQPVPASCLHSSRDVADNCLGYLWLLRERVLPGDCLMNERVRISVRLCRMPHAWCGGTVSPPPTCSSPCPRTSRHDRIRN